MFRSLFLFFLSAALLLGANFRLYLKDGSYHVVREYQVEGDRVRFYSVERGDWEEIPVALTDLQRTETEKRERAEAVRKEAQEVAAEEKFEREQRQERERVPVEPGLYWFDGKDLKTIKQADAKFVSKKSRSVLKVLSPIPVISGKTTVEVDGEHSSNVVTNGRPEFYFRLAKDERFALVRLSPKKGARLVQTWTIIPVSKELIEEQQDVEIYRKQIDEGLYQIWPTKPLEPGEYAVIEYTQGKGNVQTWDFAYVPPNLPGNH